MAQRTPRRFSIQQVFEILVRNPADLSIYGFLTDCKTSGLENTVEMVYPTGGAGNVYVGGGFAHSRRAMMNVSMATWNTEIMAIQNGTEVYEGSSEITYYDVITMNAADSKFYTKFTAIGTAGMEIAYLYVQGTDGTYSKTYTQVGAVAAAGEFAYSTATKELTFFAGDEPLAGDTLICAYTFKSADNAQRITVNADAIPAVINVAAYGIANDVCTGELFPCVVEGRAQVDGNWNFDISADGEPSVQSFGLEFLKSCTSNELYTFTVFTEDEEVTP